ncbi:hypothetical protein [Oceanobacillus halophilus]|uniref:Uncharacterized protein n=1 Tax=Oceanobacillus halophilus TaxID=930130 RepID=A0A495A3F0_9BACI|nr:hypothetical protein [Oceanobacillus halophilus]RKQ33978.1 hypothetical protein D8M06_09150 [Oceanobacillus halophilus]
MAETVLKLPGLGDDYKPVGGETHEVFAAFVGENNKNFLAFMRNERTKDPVEMLALIPSIKRKYLYEKLNMETRLSVQISQRPDKVVDYKFL